MLVCSVLIARHVIPRRIGLRVIAGGIRVLRMKVVAVSIMAVHPAVTVTPPHCTRRLASHAITVIIRMMTMVETMAVMMINR
jgi:hypothetical protein